MFAVYPMAGNPDMSFFFFCNGSVIRQTIKTVAIVRLFILLSIGPIIRLTIKTVAVVGIFILLLNGPIIR